MAVPERMGRYQIREQIGSGGFATVWHGYDERLGDGRPYFVMSYADRGTLADRLGAGDLPIDRALWYAAETARAVQVLHDHGLLHRDVKPSNVLFRSTATGEQLMIADLGLVKAMAHASGFTVAAGTPGYMSPEQATIGGDLDRRADVYALGALTYRLLVGRVPATPSSGQIPDPPSRLRPDVGTDVDAIVMRALEPQREARWPDAGTFAAALTEILGTPPHATAPAAPIGPTSGPSGPPTPATVHPGTPTRTPPSTPSSRRTEPGHRPPGRRRRLVPLIAGCGALVLLLVAGLAYVQTRNVTIESKDGAVAVTIPRAWDKGSRSPIIDVEDETDFGTTGSALMLTSGQATLKDHGVTLAADLDLGNDDPADVLNMYAPDHWPGSGCEHIDDMYQPNDRFRSGVVWTFVASCGSDRYAEAVMIGRGSTFGVHVFVTADDTEQIDDVLASITVDKDKLPEG